MNANTYNVVRERSAVPLYFIFSKNKYYSKLVIETCVLFHPCTIINPTLRIYLIDSMNSIVRENDVEYLLQAQEEIGMGTVCAYRCFVTSNP